MNNLVSNRLGGKNFFDNPAIYRFSKLIALKNEIIKNSDKELLDFGIGEPLDKPSKEVLSSFGRHVFEDGSNYYTDNGIEEFNEAARFYMNRVYDVEINKDEVIHCIGAKEALTILPLCFVNEGDIVLSCSPGYVVLENMSKWLGGKVIHLKLKEENNYLPNFNDLEEEILLNTKILYLNYPNNPTGAIASKEFYEECINYAKKYNFIIVSDAAYLPLTYEKENKFSYLNVKGAKDVGVEVHTLSKGFNMTGFRIGFVVGNKNIIKVFSSVKENMDSGQYKPIQYAAITALNDELNLNKMNEKYKRRQSLLYRILNKLNFKTNIPKAGFYQYVKVPDFIGDFKIKSAEDFAKFLLEKEQIFVIPYDNEGKYIRFSLTFIGESFKDDINYLEKLYLRLKKYVFRYLD